MNRNRQGGRMRDRGSYGGGGGGGYGDGLLGEGPPVGGPPGPGPMYHEPMVSPNPMVSHNQVNQLMLAQSLLHQQALGAAGYPGGGDYPGVGDLGPMGSLSGAMGNPNYMHHPQPGRGYGGGGPPGPLMYNDRKRMGGYNRERQGVDIKRRRHDSSGRSSDRDRPRTRDNNRGGESWDRNRSSRWDSGKGSDHGDNDYDPAEPTEDEDGIKKDSSLYCHVCNVSVYDDDSFRRHLNGAKHTQRMNSVLTVHQLKSNQLKSRLKAEEHLRKIESKGGRDPEFFCKICNNELTIPWKRHCFSNIHKQRLLQVRRGCGWCNVHDFNNFSEVLEHRETEQHKKNAEKHGKKDEDDSKYGKKEVKKEEEEEEDLTIPEYDPENAVGLKYVIPVTGFFCKLCHKFYNNEKSAKGTHCQTQTHYEKFKVVMEAKIEAMEKKKAEEEAARRAEEEENAKEGDGEMSEAADDDEDGGLKEEVKEEEEDDDSQVQNEGEEMEDGVGDDDLATDDEEGIDDSMDVEDGGLLGDTGRPSSLNDMGLDLLSDDIVQGQDDEQEPDSQEDYGLALTNPEETVEDEASADAAPENAEDVQEVEEVEEVEEEEPAVVVTPSPKGRGGTSRRAKSRGRGRGKKS